jgi:anthranilate synthase/aminodeoxychorismate synthase-like glutamine amidotransferase
MVLILDNYDSFTYNLVQYLGELGAQMEIRRNDAITVAEALAGKYSGLLVSPGPGTPCTAGNTVELIRDLSGIIPILGVCLGHQAIAEAFGGNVVRAERPVHGKASEVSHDGCGVFSGLPQPLLVGRYHSLVVESESLPACLRVTAQTPDGIIMALRHATLPVEGVQFHPESVLTEHGKQMLGNFLRQCGG